MERIKKILKISTYTVLSFFIALVVYANWEEPSLSDKLNLKPIELRVFTLNNDVSTEDSLQIAKNLADNKGITASTINPQGKTISITYHADETSESELQKAVEAEKFEAKKVDFTAFKGPQCPVPSEYIDFIINTKKALCFR
ncbi:hypothetical protein VB796_03325 [Arcicella sp. LKC2W]|uniref:hypothetical protein n=1 Tax=Arcicella sp. LKC2W TaxID=2984198 RepID=UPI002B2159CE|nr:hypothetical protein [Arcicella sp. LKC2W]MEA5458049.1 hypothetical protein [Arcicella sp. LKC2W]